MNAAARKAAFQNSERQQRAATCVAQAERDEAERSRQGVEAKLQQKSTEFLEREALLLDELEASQARDAMQRRLEVEQLRTEVSAQKAELTAAQEQVQLASSSSGSPDDQK